MHFSHKTSKAFLPLVLTSAIAAAITGCNGGSGGDDSAAKETVDVQSTSTFSAIYMGQVDHNVEHQASAVEAERSPQAVTYFEGTLTAVDTATNQPQAFDWPLVLGEDGMVTSQKTVTLEPGTYDFTLVVNRGSQQYTAVLLQYQIDDQGEYRLDFQLDPVAGDTIVDFDNVKLMSRLQLEFPIDELAAIDAPQIGLIVDGVETIYQLNKNTGMADITLNYQEGTHSYDVNLYNGNQLIARSALGPQSIDLEQNTDFKLDLISLQADVTVDISNLSEPNFIFKIPQEIIDHVGDVANVNLMARITDNETVQEVTLPVELIDGEYKATHTFDAIEGSQVAAYLEFLDITDGGSEVISTCADSINISQPNNLDCPIEIAKDYVIGGNLLATLAINVLDVNKVAQSGAQVFVNDELVGVTGNSFGTDGFIKVHVKAGEEHSVRAEKSGLKDSQSRSPDALGIHNIDLILSNPTLVTGYSCKSIYDEGRSNGDGRYILNIAGEEVETWCDMTNGGWTLAMRAYGGSLTNEWMSTQRGALNTTAEKSPTMTETFKLSDSMINTLHEGRQLYRIISDHNGRMVYSAGQDYCHNIADECQSLLGVDSPLDAYMGVYLDESLDPSVYEDGLNSDGYTNIRGGIGSDTQNENTVFIMTYSIFGNRGWSLGGALKSPFCTGQDDPDTNACHFSMWVK